MKRFLRHIPNILSGLRLVAAPAVALLILEGHTGWALLIFAFAGLSDALDGYLAKTFAFTSEFGAILDPTADKLLMLASFITLSLAGMVPWWLTAAVIGRDVAIVTGIAMAKTINAPLKVAPRIAGKISTAIQVGYVALMLLLRTLNITNTALETCGDILVTLAAAWSLAAYARVWLKAIVAQRTGVG